MFVPQNVRPLCERLVLVVRVWKIWFPGTSYKQLPWNLENCKNAEHFGAAFYFNQIGLAYLRSSVPIFHPEKYFKRANYKMHYKTFKTQSNESITNYNLACFQI